jgi:hypothetical protein
MSILDIASLMRRHIVAVMLMLVIAAVVGFGLEHSRPMYNDTTTVDFKTQANPFVEADALLVTSDLMSRSMMSPQSERLVREAGGTAGYQVDLVNLYNLEYPNYSDPYVTVSVTASNPADVRNTFNAVMRVLADELRTWQAGRGIPSVDQIGLYALSGTQGVVPLSGYPKRTLGALLVLTVIAIFLVTKFLDKHQIQPFSTSHGGQLLARVRRSSAEYFPIRARWPATIPVRKARTRAS